MSQKELEKAEAQGFNEYFKLTTKINTSNMICFDPEGKIKKYNSPEQILEEFYPLRLAYYQKRKVCNELESVASGDANVFITPSIRTSWPVNCRIN